MPPHLAPGVALPVRLCPPPTPVTSRTGPSTSGLRTGKPECPSRPDVIALACVCPGHRAAHGPLRPPPVSCFSGAVEMPGKGRIKFWETREGRTRPTGIWLRGEEWECRCFSEVDSGSRASRWAAGDRHRSGRAAGHPGRGGRTVGAAKTTVQGQTEQNTEGMRKSSEDSEVSVETQLIRCKQRPVRKKKKPPTFTPEISKYEHLGRNKNSVGATLGKYLKLRDDNENLK